MENRSQKCKICAVAGPNQTINSESDSDHSDYTDEDQENEHETDPWASLKMEAMTKNMPEFQADGDFYCRWS